MPELPEVESVRRGLASRLGGRRVAEADLLRPDVLKIIGGKNAGTKRADRLLLAGDTFAGFRRHGKHLAIVGLSGRALEVHLGMSGQLLVLAPSTAPAREDHVHARWRFDDGSMLLFRDPRRFGGLWAATSFDALHAARWRRLGPDALDFSVSRFRAALAGSRRAIKTALLDQHRIAGVGNIYADEALFEARIHPERESGSLDAGELTRLGGVQEPAVFLPELRDEPDDDGRKSCRDVDHGRRRGELTFRQDLMT